MIDEKLVVFLVFEKKLGGRGRIICSTMIFLLKNILG